MSHGSPTYRSAIAEVGRELPVEAAAT